MISVVLYNGECTITASEDYTIEEACKKHNRFVNVDFMNSRLEYRYTSTAHETEKVCFIIIIQ